MRKPDFFVVGASRSGTTSLYYYLIQHPSIAVPVKGPSFETSRRAFCGSVFQFLGVEHFPIRLDRVYNPSGPPRSRFLGRILSQPFPGRRRLTRSLPRKIKELRLRLVERNLGQRPVMSRDTRALLVEQFREDVGRLQEILDRDLGHWLAVP